MVAKPKTRLPHHFEPRPYQVPFLRAMDNGLKRAVCCWHRRAGKDKTFLNFMIKRMFERIGNYYYYFPAATDGRKAIWDNIDRNGFHFLDHFPKELFPRNKRNATEMRIEAVNGSVFRIIGTDMKEPVGPNPVGCVFSEYSLQRPSVWDKIRPILAENEGWAVFNFTSRGKNHGYRLYMMAKENPNWFCELLTVDDTNAIKPEAIQDEIDAGMAPDMVQQEFYCSFDLGAEGSYYAKLIAEAYNVEPPRVTNVPCDDTALVYTFWDLGVDDDTAIWFVQFIGKEIRLIDYYHHHGEGLSHYAKVLRNLPYNYGQHYLPHDVKARMQGRTIETRLDILKTLLSEPIEVVEEHLIEDGIAAAKGIISLCWFDKTKCARGLDCLENYRQKYDEKLKAYSGRPFHDEFSHAADAFRYLAIAYRYQLLIDHQRIGYPHPISSAPSSHKRRDRLASYR
ncbi:hypothetical protein LCGC14_0358720 [marine sediment metagenome]|uniref:Phage terminase large subunit N-terminal domain-containing protein n=1 Tax=marine sediment metagenome TaxID=412755 RepID=A0A0F9TRM0_9ZZZZ